jgi:hypothetical protein
VDRGHSLRPQTKLGNLKKADARGCGDIGPTLIRGGAA